MVDYAGVLHRRLNAAGIPIDGVSLKNQVFTVHYASGATQQQRDAGQVIVGQFNFNNEDMANNTVNTVRSSSKAAVQNIPNWGQWTQAQFQAWVDANISNTQIDALVNLADAKGMLKMQAAAITAMGKLLIAIRNNLFPDLQG